MSHRRAKEKFDTTRYLKKGINTLQTVGKAIQDASKAGREKLMEVEDEILQQVIRMDDSPDNWTKEEFLQFLERLNVHKRLNEFPLSRLFFVTETIQTTAADKIPPAKEKYAGIVEQIKEMRKKKMPNKEIYEYILRFQGEYSENNSRISDLLVEGKGNCEARAKLMAMLIQDAFGEEVEVYVQVLNIFDPVLRKPVKHLRTVIKDKGKYYTLEFPKVISGKKTPKGTLFSRDIFARAYLAEHGKQEYSTEESNLPEQDLADTRTDSDFHFPNSPVVEYYAEQNISYRNIVIQGLEKSIGTEKKWELELGNFSQIRVLDDPELARIIVERSEGADTLNLDGLEVISSECAAIINQFKGEYVLLRNPNGVQLDAETVKALMENHNRYLYLTVRSNLPLEVFKEFSDLKSPRYLRLFVKGEFPKELAQAVGGGKGKKDFIDKFFSTLEVKIEHPWTAELIKTLYLENRGPLIFDSTYPISDEALSGFTEMSEIYGFTKLKLGRPITAETVKVVSELRMFVNDSDKFRIVDDRMILTTSGGIYSFTLETSENLDGRIADLFQQSKRKDIEFRLHGGNVTIDGAEKLNDIGFKRMWIKVDHPISPEVMQVLEKSYKMEVHHKPTSVHSQHKYLLLGK